MELVHVFLLYVFLDGQVKSKDMHFWDVDECVYFARRLHKQGGKITAYCLPVQVRRDTTRIY